MDGSNPTFGYYSRDLKNVRIIAKDDVIIFTRYYFTEDYVAATGTVTIDDEEYYFDHDTAEL